MRASINSMAPCPAAPINQGLCLGNSPFTADFAGNPNLQPERAFSFNLSYTLSFSGNNQLSIEYFQRRFDKKFGQSINLENVAWATVPRYVTRPDNFGDALSQGIDLGVQAKMQEFWPQGPDLHINGSLGYAQSRIDGIPGPNNRFVGQSPWRAKINLSYSVPNHPIKFDVDSNWEPSGWVRDNVSSEYYNQKIVNVNGSASWKVSNKLRWVFKINNLFPRARNGLSLYYVDDTVTQFRSHNENYRSFSARVEIKL